MKQHLLDNLAHMRDEFAQFREETEDRGPIGTGADSTRSVGFHWTRICGRTTRWISA